MLIITCIVLGHLSRDDEQFLNNIIMPKTTFDS
jgi:hypothetical protein